MTTYDSYEAAKIANPDKTIYKLASGYMSTNTPQGESVHKCNPADHCMTVEQFLKAGHSFVYGDLFLGQDGSVVKVSNTDNYNATFHGDDKRHILRAAALEEKKPELTKDDSPQGVISAISNRLHNIGCELQDSELGEELGSMACDIWGVLPMISNESIEDKKPKRVEVSYEKVEAPCDFFNLKSEFRKEELYFVNASGDYEFATTIVELALAFDGMNLYRRVENEISECDEFIEFIKTKFNNDKRFIDKTMAEALFDAGCRFKLVKGE